MHGTAHRDRAGLKQLLCSPAGWSTPPNARPGFLCDTRSKIPAGIKVEEHHGSKGSGKCCSWFLKCQEKLSGNSTVPIPSHLLEHLPDAGAVLSPCEPPAQPRGRAGGRCTEHRGEKPPVGQDRGWEGTRGALCLQRQSPPKASEAMTDELARGYPGLFLSPMMASGRWHLSWALAPLLGAHWPRHNCPWGS